MAHRTSNTSVTNQVGILAELLHRVQLVWRLLVDRRVPLPTKLIIPGVVGVYVLSPIDLMPDVLLLLGQIDDLAVLLAGIALFIELCPKEIVEEHRAALARPSAPDADSSQAETVDAEYRVIE